MRSITITCVFALLAVAAPAAAQEWVPYVSERDAFEAQFPEGQVTVTEATWESQSGFTLPSRVYSMERGPRRYTVTVADYRQIEELGKARIKQCKNDDEICVGSNLSGEGFWKHDTRGAMEYAVSKLLTRPDTQVTDIAWNQIARVSTILVSTVNTRDGSKSYALVTMYELMLYIVEGTAPKEAPSPVQFAGSFSPLVRGTNRPPSYATLYVHSIHALREAPLPPPNPPGGGGPVLFKRD